MKRKFKLADGTRGMLDTDTGEFTPYPEGTNDAPLADSPEAAQLAAHPAPGLEHEDPIGDVIVGNAVAGGLPKLLGAAGRRLAGAGANATTRLAAKAAEEEAARVAAQAAPGVPVSPLKRFGTMVKEPVKTAVDAATHVGENAADRALASPTMTRLASAAQAPAVGHGAQGLAWLLELLGHSGGNGMAASSGVPTVATPMDAVVPRGANQ